MILNTRIMLLVPKENLLKKLMEIVLPFSSFCKNKKKKTYNYRKTFFQRMEKIFFRTKIVGNIKNPKKLESYVLLKVLKNFK